ncbi:MAG: hypothetical protein L0214_07530 [candidate division NC10 bacterium]|nr:hypothetical protein [candidate division NC10 bacterium]
MRRRRRNPATWAHGAMRYGHRVNPGRGGVGVGTLALLGGAAFVLLTPQGKAMLSSLRLGGGPAPLPSGYTTVGSNLYRGPDGALYARNPYTGAMVRAPAGTVPTSGSDLLAKAQALGVSLIPTVGAKVADWLGGLFSSQQSATTVLGEAGSVATGVYIDPGPSPFPALPPIDYSLPELPYQDYAGMLDYSMPLDVVDYSLPDVPLDYSVPLDAASYFYPQVDYSIPDVGGEWAGFFGLGLEERRGPRYLRRPASRL